MISNKKAILVISSGSSDEKARKENIEAVEKRIAEAFKDYEIKRAFTSYKIIERLKQKGINIDTPMEAMKKIAAEGIKELVIQPLHIIPGLEYEKIIKAAVLYKGSFEKIQIGRPVLFEERDYRIAAKALKNQLPDLEENQAVVLMGHGSSHTAQECYLKLQKHFDYENIKAYIATINGFPGIKDIISKLKENTIEEVILMPYMLVAGNHAAVDMASDDENSWKSSLQKNGFTVRIYMRGLGENREYQNIYIAHIREVIED